MNIPKQLMIGSVPYDVEVVKGWIDEKEDGEVRIAEVTYHEQHIKISDNVSKHEGQMKNVLHEAIHAMLYEYGLDRLNKEVNVNALTTVFFDFIKNNIRGGVSSFVGTDNYDSSSEKEDFISSKLQMILDGTEISSNSDNKSDHLSFINTAEELATTLEKHKPKVDVSALGAAMAQVEVHKKAVNLGQTRKLPIINENRGSFPMEEVVKITKKKDKSGTADQAENKGEADPIHWKTGIKYDDEGAPKYRTRYECCMCGNRGNQYEYEGNKFTKCHKCNMKLKIVQATKKGFPERDAFGNFYVANDEYSEFLAGGVSHDGK